MEKWNKDILKEIRQKLELSQEELSRLLGVSLITINRWERGVNIPLPFFQKKIKELLRDTKQKKKEK